MAPACKRSTLGRRVLRPRRTGAGGFTLLEVLITATVVAGALLGLAALQARSLHAVTEGQRLTLAARLLQEVQESVHANRVAVSLYRAELKAEQPLVPAPADCSNTPCSPAQLAAYDKQRWHRVLKGCLTRTGCPRGAPFPRGKLEIKPKAGEVAVELKWKDAVYGEQELQLTFVP